MIGAAAARVRSAITFEVGFARDAYEVWKQARRVLEMQREAVRPASITIHSTGERRDKRKRAA